MLIWTTKTYHNLPYNLSSHREVRFFMTTTAHSCWVIQHSLTLRLISTKPLLFFPKNVLHGNTPVTRERKEIGKDPIWTLHKTASLWVYTRTEIKTFQVVVRHWIFQNWLHIVPYSTKHPAPVITLSGTQFSSPWPWHKLVIHFWPMPCL